MLQGFFSWVKFGPIIILVYIMNLELMNSKKYFILPEPVSFPKAFGIKRLV